MIRINQMKLPIFTVGTDRDLEQKLLFERAAKLLKVQPDGIRKLRIVRRSVDARNKAQILFVYTVDVRLHDSITGPSLETERAFVGRLKNRNISCEAQVPVTLRRADERLIACMESGSINPPVIVGAGPCGLFAALLLAEAGLKPVVLERGMRAEERMEEIERFFETGHLSPDTNVQFGEGGAGTFSDGKLNTSIKGQNSYIRFVLETFVRFGADPDILIEQKPHIGTDQLVTVVSNLRKHIESKGGRFLFQTKLTGFLLKEDAATGERVRIDGVTAEVLSKKGSLKELKTDACLLAIGHSARDTFAFLSKLPLTMEQKPFAMGLRVQHPQEWIDRALYGADRLSEKQEILGPASYKLVHQCKNGRAVYSFCMCPGGYVVNSSSEEKRLCVNGMSYHDRGSGMANAALIVTVGTEDFPDKDVLSGMELQRSLEEKAYALLDGVIPYESYGEFRQKSEAPTGGMDKAADEAVDEAILPCFRGYGAPADVRSILPSFIAESIEEGMEAFGKSIRGYDDHRAILAGVETRTSSPIRILRDDEGESSILGLYPAGEGAGYAGGITSAAIDGLKAAEKLLKRLELFAEQRAL